MAATFPGGRKMEGRKMEGRKMEGRKMEGRKMEGRKMEGRKMEGRRRFSKAPRPLFSCLHFLARFLGGGLGSRVAG
jgi:hypothetical protein